MLVPHLHCTVSIHGKVVAGNSELRVPHLHCRDSIHGKMVVGSNESEMNKKTGRYSLFLNYIHLIVPMVLLPGVFAPEDDGAGGVE